MPGIIGLFTENRKKIERLKNIVSSSTPIPFTSHEIGNGVVFSHSFSRGEAIETEDYYLAGDGQHQLYSQLQQHHKNIIAALKGDNSSPLLNMGNTCAYFKGENQSIISTDLLASIPLYYYTDAEVFLYSSHIKLIHRFINKPFSTKFLLQFLRNGYIAVGHTVFEDIKKLKPGEKISYCHTTKNMTHSFQKSLWSEAKKQPISHSRQIDTIVKNLIHEFELLGKNTPKTMLMSSGGWDSRTLLAILTTSKTWEMPELYYHGDIDSKEYRIVERLSNVVKGDLTASPLTDQIYRVQTLEDNLRHTENTLFPHWNQAGLTASQKGLKLVISGVFGESLGGHYGPPMINSGIGKILSLYKYLLGFDSLSFNKRKPSKSEVRQFVLSMLIPSPINKPWYFTQEFWSDNYSNYILDIGEIIGQVVDNYIERGITTTEDLIEAYITEHRGSQYINAQMLACRKYVDISYPFGCSPVLETAASIPFSFKVHNTINRELIRQRANKLLEIPTAAILVKAKRPIAVQESSRILRKSSDILKPHLEKLVGVKNHQSKSGWANLQFLDGSGVMEEIVDSLQLYIWDKDSMNDFIKQYSKINSHSLMDMLLKIKTMDHLIS